MNNVHSLLFAVTKFYPASYSKLKKNIYKCLKKYNAVCFGHSFNSIPQHFDTKATASASLDVKCTYTIHMEIYN